MAAKTRGKLGGIDDNYMTGTNYAVLGHSCGKLTAEPVPFNKILKLTAHSTHKFKF